MARGNSMFRNGGGRFEDAQRADGHNDGSMGRAAPLET